MNLKRNDPIRYLIIKKENIEIDFSDGYIISNLLKFGVICITLDSGVLD